MPADAERLIRDARFIWHQRFRLTGDLYTPGVSDVELLFERSELPHDLTGATVLDVGTTNGGAAFEAERRGAREVVAVDIYPPEWFGFAELRSFLGSSVEFVRANVYELPTILRRQFDIVLFWGVLYHLRHPLLALDALRALTGGHVFVETEVADGRLSKRAPGLAAAALGVSLFHRRDELAGDGSNWFAPMTDTLVDWCESSGLTVEVLGSWPREAPTRCMLRAEPTPGDPEFFSLSYERHLHVSAQPVDVPERVPAPPPV